MCMRVHFFLFETFLKFNFSRESCFACFMFACSVNRICHMATLYLLNSLEYETLAETLCNGSYRTVPTSLFGFGVITLVEGCSLSSEEFLYPPTFAGYSDISLALDPVFQVAETIKIHKGFNTLFCFLFFWPLLRQIKYFNFFCEKIVNQF